MKLAVVGAGYVGSVSAAGLAAAGHQVALYDLDPERVRALVAGRLDMYEPGLAELIARAASRLRGAESVRVAVEGAQTVLICVDTPAREDGSIDLSRVERAFHEVVNASSAAPLVVTIRSTVVPGTTDRLDREVLTPLRARGRKIEAAANPEFLREGRAVADFMEPDRIVLGTSSAWAREVLAELYAFSDAPVMQMSAASAELAKYASNALLATLVSFSNELAALAEAVEGADVLDALRVVHGDRRWRLTEGRWEPAMLNYLWPGCGYGGSCLPKDVKAILAEGKRRGVDLTLLAATDAVNQRQVARVADQIASVEKIAGRRVAVLGMAFKEGTADARSSPGLAIARELRGRGARVVAYDPLLRHLNAEGIEQAPDLEAALHESQVWVVVTGALEFNDLPRRAAQRGVLLVDARRRFAAGPAVRYVGPGRGSQAAKQGRNPSA